MDIGGKNLKKWILVGSSISVVILVLLSFTSVIGFQSVKSNSRIISPLFDTRINRAKNIEQDTVNSNYIGKEKEITISLPKIEDRGNRSILLQNTINIIRKLDDKEFIRFQSLIISHIYKVKKDKNIDVANLLSALKQIRSNNKEIYIDLSNDKKENKKNQPTYYCFTDKYVASTCINDKICFWIWFSIFMIMLIGEILFWVLADLTIRVCSVQVCD